jgi:desumoylating isopeptidase 1
VRKTMDVQLYVYDLSGGMARQYSQMLTGVQIDAIYHTAIVFNNVEYFFGQGIHRKVPGSTHHGRPMKIVSMGQTDLPVDVVEEYVESLEDIYTPESYDLFLHNCNNFSQDLAMFLVGKSIPDEIRNLPETFLRTPMGQMLRGQLDQSMRSMTQAPDAMSGRDAVRRQSNNSAPKSRAVQNGNSPGPVTNGSGHKAMPPAIINASLPSDTPGQVHNVTTPSEVDKLLASASASCAVIFFTSATCPPCKICYPTYEELAAETGTSSGAKLIKIDISASPSAQAVAQRYGIRATPTFITFLKGQKQDEWAGADPNRLKGIVRLLMQMAKPPQHAHSKLRLPSFQRLIETPMLYPRTPPLEKLLAKLGPEFAQNSTVQAIVSFIKARDTKGATEAPLPDLHAFSTLIANTLPTLPRETHFALIDLVRILASDSRVSSFLATEPGSKTLSLLLPSGGAQDFTSAPYNTQSVSLQLACNLFTSRIFQEKIFGVLPAEHPTPGSTDLKSSVEYLAAQCLLSPHLNARAMAAALVYNISSYTHNRRMHAQMTTSNDDSEGEGEGAGDDLGAALLESITSLPTLPAPASPSAGTVKETLHALLLALGMLLYAAPVDDMLWDLCRAMDLRDTLKEMGKRPDTKGEPLIKEVGDELLGKGGF